MKFSFISQNPIDLLGLASIVSRIKEKQESTLMSPRS